MNAKNPPPEPKHHDAQNVHPEIKPRRPETGVPGTDSSKRRGSGQDPRNADDKDGNEQHTSPRSPH